MAPFGPGSDPGATFTKYKCPGCGKTWTEKNYNGKSEMEKICSSCSPSSGARGNKVRCSRCGTIYNDGVYTDCPDCGKRNR